MIIGRRLLNMSDETVTNRLSRDDNTKKDYSDLLKRPGPLQKSNTISSKDIFLLALAFGYEKNIKVPLLNKKQFINDNNFGKILPQLLTSLAIINSPKQIEVLSEKPSEIYKYAEEYANGGLELLKNEYIGKEDLFIEMLRIKIQKANKNNQILDELKKLNL